MTHLGQRGTASLLLGQTAEAAEDLAEAARSLLRLGQTFYALHCLERLAAAVSIRHPDIAAIAVAVIDSSPEFNPEKLSLILRERYLADLPARIGVQAFADLQRRGRGIVESLGTTGAISAVLDMAANDSLA